MAPPERNLTLHTYHICVLLILSTATLCAALAASSYSTACPSLAPAQDRHTKADDALSLIRSFQISAGQFFRGAGGLFSPDDDPYNARSFNFFPHGASRTDDPTLVHLTATFTLTDPLRNDSGADSVSFFLDGYYSSATLKLCMVGMGTERAEDGSLKHYPDVALRLRVPSPPSLADPFVTGSLEGGAGLGTIRLLAYAEGGDYEYGSERAACSPSPPKQPARGSLRVLGGNHSVSVCARLTPQLMTSYRLDHGGTLLSRMRVHQMHCAVDGTGVHVRAYAVLSNDATPTERHEYYHRQRSFLVHEEAVVADGHWDSDRRMLCLRACRVELPVPPSAPAVREHVCGIGMSFWFPAVWTMRERSIVAGMLWNSSQAGAGLVHGLITASSIDGQRSSTNLSDVKYSYNDTLLEEATKHYLKISKEKKITGSQSFPDFNTTVRDFEFGFYGPGIRSGEAYPLTVGSAMVAGNMLAADDSFSRHAVVYGDKKLDVLVNVSYDIRYSAPRDNWVRASNVSSYSNYSIRHERRRISAEGVYDPKRGLLCMVGCRERNGSTDCEILVTVQFAALDSMAREHGTGVISSLRDKTDGLFFEKIHFTSYGMYAAQVSEDISRMDLESIMMMATTTLSCVFIVLQILHTKRNPEAAPATSVTMLAVLTMGYLAPLALNTEALFASRRSQYFPYEYPTSRWIEMNEVVMRAPNLIAFVLQLRLLQLAWSGRRTSTVSERTVLGICVPLYVLGGVLAAVIHAINARAAASGDPSVIVMGGGPTAIWEDLVSYAGLILDGFLLPQVILNASLGRSRVGAISPWFYIGGTMVRVAPHVYDVVRAHVYKPSMHSSDMYASPHGDLFGVAWDVVIPCGAALLALLMFLQQRLGGTASLPWQRRRSGGYEMVSNI